MRGTKVIGDNVWHQIVFVIDRELGLFLYVDGVLDISKSSVGAQAGNLTNNDPLTIGKIVSGQHFAGGIDDVRLFKRALTSTEASQLYASEALPPEIEVRQPSFSLIADGGIKNFGAVVVNSAKSLIFTIKNTGEGDLTGLGITFDGTDPGVFSVTAPPASPVPGPSGSTTFTIQFAPTTSGPKTAALHIANNDTDENPFDITLLGNVSAQEAWRQTHFGSIQNTGDGADLNDYERDGLVNLVEFAFGLNPKQNSAGQLPQGQIIGPNYVIFFNQPSGVSGITYGAEWSTTLVPLDWTNIPDTGTPPQHTFSVPISSNTRMFTRLTVTSP